MDALLKEFISFRDSLPADHERRQKLSSVDGIRQDSFNTKLVHLTNSADPGDIKIRKYDASLSVVVNAENITLYPAHSVLKITPKEVYADRTEFSRHLKVRDAYRIDSGKIILHCEPGIDNKEATEIVQEWCDLQIGQDEYIVNKIFRCIGSGILRSGEVANQVELNLSLETTFVWLVIFSTSMDPEFMASVKQKMEVILAKIDESGPGDSKNSDLVRKTLATMFPTIWGAEGKASTMISNVEEFPVD